MRSIINNERLEKEHWEELLYQWSSALSITSTSSDHCKIHNSYFPIIKARRSSETVRSRDSLQEQLRMGWNMSSLLLYEPTAVPLARIEIS